MTKVFIVTAGEHSDYGIAAVFSTEGAAQRYCDTRNTGGYGDDHRIEEYELDEPVPDLVRYKASFGSGESLYLSVYDREEDDTPKERIRVWTDSARTSMQVEFLIDARDAEHARKIAGEKGAMAFSGQKVYPVVKAYTSNTLIGYGSLIRESGGWTVHFVEGPPA
jgi:hypothetical protein